MSNTKKIASRGVNKKLGHAFSSKYPMRNYIIAGLWGCLFVGAQAGEPAQESDALQPWMKGNISTYWDNDALTGNDSNYTNGLRLAWISAEKTEDDFNLIDRSLRKVIGDSESWGIFQNLAGFEDPSAVRYQRGIALTQLIYTPRDQDAIKPPGQRPYAGWLGLGYSLHAKDANAQSSVEFVIGVIGPSSHAQDLQDWWHDLNDGNHFEGWDSQIPDEVTLNLYFTNKRRLHFLEHGDKLGVSSDGYSTAGVALGTFKTDAHLGFMTRFGWNLPSETSDPRISEFANKQNLFADVSTPNSSWSTYLLIGGKVTGIAHDATLDGPVFRDYDTGVDKENFTAEVYAGIGFRIKRLDFGYVHTLKTNEFETQKDSSAYGTLMLSYSF